MPPCVTSCGPKATGLACSQVSEGLLQEGLFSCLRVGAPDLTALLAGAAAWKPRRREAGCPALPPRTSRRDLPSGGGPAPPFLTMRRLRRWRGSLKTGLLGSETALMGSHAWAPLLLSLRDDDALTARSLAEGGTVTWEEHVKTLLQGEGFDPPPELSRSFPVNASYASGGLVNSGVRSGYLQSGKKKSF